jgi:hypothetical protein
MIFAAGSERRLAPLNRFSRRLFIERSLKLAGLAGFSRPPLGAFGGPVYDEVSETRRDRFFGVQAHFGQFRTEVDKFLDLAHAAGIGWIRDEVYWSEIEKEKGLFRFPPSYDYYLKAAHLRSLEVLLILDFSNPLYTGSDKRAPSTGPERQAFARYCREVVARYAPLGVRHFEIWNEPNASTFWKPQPDPEDYARLLEVAYGACKGADPVATVLGCSTAGVDLDFIGRVMRAGGGPFMDGVSVHPYCQPLPPERRLVTDLSKLIRLVPDKPLWITEFGYPTYAGPDGVDEEMQANYLVRAGLLARSAPAVKGFCWYDLQNDGEDPDEGEFNFGLVRRDGTPKPAYAAYKTMASLVGSLPPAELAVDGGTYSLRIGEGRTSRFAVWRLGGTASVEIPCPRGPCRIVERDGASRILRVDGRLLEVDVSEKPRYIVPAA